MYCVYPDDGLPEEPPELERERCIDKGILIPQTRSTSGVLEGLISVIPGRTGKTVGLDQHDD
jgi:hypothetical protein